MAGAASPAPRPPPPVQAAPIKKISVALQGGGAHGAFTWGVLDYLLEDRRIEIEGLSGTSAGALNAVMVADGLARGGPSAARTRLAEFWRAVSIDGQLPLAERKIMEQLFSAVSSGELPMQVWFDAWARSFSPYDFNPLNINPLSGLLARFVDFEAVRRYELLALYISATNVITGRLRIFPREKISAEVVMASACLPAVFQAVTIDGVPYWDGGYIGNPVIFPLFHGTAGEDVLIVQINPVERRELPTSAHDIADRVTEITFNASLLAEYRAIEFVSRLIDQGRSAARHRPRPVPARQCSSHYPRRRQQELGGRQQITTPTMTSSACSMLADATPRRPFLMRITTISAIAAPSISPPRHAPNGREPQVIPLSRCRHGRLCAGSA